MPLHKVKHKNIDFKKWDKCINSATNSHVYAKSWYLNIVSPNWQGVILNDYEAVMPLTTKTKLGITLLRQPPFCQQLGVFFTTGLSPETTQAFYKHLNNFWLTDYQLNSSNKVTTGKQRTNHELSLDKTYEDIYSGFNTNTKRNINKAKKGNLEAIFTSDYQSVIAYFKKTKGKTLNLTDDYYVTLQKIISEGLKRKEIKIIHILNQQKEMVSGAILLEHPQRTYFLFSANNKKNAGAMHYLINEYIKLNCERKIIFDFEGSDDENLAKFYTGFGAKKATYTRIKKGIFKHIL